MGTNVKFFQKNLLDETTTITATSMPTFSLPYLYNYSNILYSESSGSSDSIDEVLTFVFSVEKQISMIHISGLNAKSFDIKYWDGSSYVDFSPAISTTTHSSDIAFFEFTQVETFRIRITLKTTQVANQQKRISEVVFSNLLREMTDNPSKITREIIDVSSVSRTSLGLVMKTKFSEVRKMDLDWAYVGIDDFNFLISLQASQTTFLVLLGGGDTTNNQSFFKLSDLIRVVVTGSIDFKLRGDLVGIGDSCKMTLEESAR